MTALDPKQNSLMLGHSVASESLLFGQHQILSLRIAIRDRNFDRKRSGALSSRAPEHQRYVHTEWDGIVQDRKGKHLRKKQAMVPLVVGRRWTARIVSLSKNWVVCLALLAQG